MYSTSLKLSLLFLLSGLMFGSTAQYILKIEFVSQTRGYRESVLFEEGQVKIVVQSVEERIDTTFMMDPNDWKRLKSIVNTRFFKEMPKWRGVSVASATDRARASTVNVWAGQRSATSQPFDNFEAPKKLMPIIDFVRKYRQSISLD